MLMKTLVGAQRGYLGLFEIQHYQLQYIPFNNMTPINILVQSVHAYTW